LHAYEIPTLRLLHSEWFPLCYDEDFYTSIAEKRFSTLVARNDLNEIIGLAIYRVQPLSDLPAGCEDFPHLPSSLQAAYLMTLGVVQEWRGMGVARDLLMCLIQFSNNSRSVDNQIPLLYLHVVEYNNPAIALYSKCGFERVAKKREFYFIKGQYYSAITLAWFGEEDLKPGWGWSCLGFI
jgi:RimJ/RimL family protein N-acetyltransferase